MGLIKIYKQFKNFLYIYLYIYMPPKHKNKAEFLKFKVSVLEASISSLLSCNQTVTDLIMQKIKIEEELNKLNPKVHNK